MRMPAKWSSPIAIHAARVALVATVVIGALYVCVVAGFDVVDRHRLVGQIDVRINQRLANATQQPSSAASVATYDNAHDTDDAPVFLWKVESRHNAVALTPGAPSLPASLWSPAERSNEARLGSGNFQLQSKHIDATWFVVGQSMAEVDHVESDLIALETVAGPALILAVFFGTFLIGMKAANPVELARRRQLEFTADASHELRTPLSVIEAEVSLALSSTRSTEEYRDTLSRVNRESLRLRDIVEDLLWLSRFDSEPPPPGDEPVDVGAIAKGCADRFDAVASRRGIALTVVQLSEGQPWVSAPPEWIDRLTGVLVDNACRYAGDNGVVRLTVGAQGNRVSLTVEDNGPGIAPEARTHLFDRFHRATDEGNGAGLGLAIGDAVVRSTAGEWLVGQSALGGASFEVRWHRSPGAKEVVERIDSGRVDSPGNTASRPAQRATTVDR